MVIKCKKIVNIVNLEKCAENAIHFHANQLQLIPAMVAVGSYPEQTTLKIRHEEHNCIKVVGAHLVSHLHSTAN